MRRVLGYRTIRDFDPFLMLDGFDSSNPEDYIKGFPWHPHRGIETVTYLLKDDIDHGLTWINGWDPQRMSRFDYFYNVESTPLIYILDRNKTIIA
ncbi:MAG: pirin family protein, partial [Bacteroidales bacterium]|nr:pirin family protein [Bacteroidales bacterium]